MDYIGLIAAARQEVQMLFEITRELGSSLSVDDTMSMLMVRRRPMVPHHCMAIWVRRENVLTPALCATRRRFPAFLSSQARNSSMGLNFPGMGSGKPQADCEWKSIGGNRAPGGRHEVLNAAIRDCRAARGAERRGRRAGVVPRDHDASFSKEHLRLLLAISGKIGISIENALRFRQAESSVSVDFLTGSAPMRASCSCNWTANWRAHRGARICRRRRPWPMDLNGFKQINDRFGHLEGDRVLRGLATGLKAICREYDTVARMGGDEFVILLPGARPEDIENRLAQFRSVLSSVCHERFAGELLTMSVGTASFPADGADAEALLSQADRRMYAEKRTHQRPASLCFRNQSGRGDGNAGVAGDSVKILNKRHGLSADSSIRSRGCVHRVNSSQ